MPPRSWLTSSPLIIWWVFVFFHEYVSCFCRILTIFSGFWTYTHLFSFLLFGLLRDSCKASQRKYNLRVLRTFWMSLRSMLSREWVSLQGLAWSIMLRKKCWGIYMSKEGIYMISRGREYIIRALCMDIPWWWRGDICIAWMKDCLVVVIRKKIKNLGFFFFKEK